MLAQALWMPGEFLDAHERRPPVWAAVTAGAALGLVWGIAARLWMRLISTNPEFSVAGTAFILAVPTVFGVGAGLAFAARRRGWRRGGHYLPRGLVVALFIPFGVAGGGPLMVTVLLATLAVTQATRPLIRFKRWLPRMVQSLLLLLALGGVVFVSGTIVTDKPGVLAPVYILFYLLLGYALFLGLRIGLEPAHAASNPPMPEQPNDALQPTGAAIFVSARHAVSGGGPGG